MTITYLKKATLTSTSDSSDVKKTVEDILNDIEAGGDAKAMAYAKKFDNYDGNILLTRDEIEAAKALVPEKLKQDINFAHDNVRRFAEIQRETLQDIEIEIALRADGWPENNPCGYSRMLYTRRTLQPYCQRHHDCHHREGRGV